MTILLAAVWMGACSSSAPAVVVDGGGDGSSVIDVAVDDTAADAVTSDAATDAASSPAARALNWVLAGLNGAALTESDVAAQCSAAFLAQVPAVQLLAFLKELSAARPYTLVRFEGAATDRALVAVVTDGAQQYGRISVATDGAGRIDGLLFQIAPDLDPTLSTWAAVDQATAALAPKANLMAATIDDGGCTPTHVQGADTSLAIGSSFKLWVLAALAQDIAAGRHAWTDTLAISDAHKSLPSGVLQNQPTGTALPLLTFASNMISISDNTAADHLLFFLGRPAVEAMLATTGHHDPTLNQPFLGTRELFNLKLMVTPTEQQSYIAADIAGRRALLDTFNATYDPRTYQGPDWLAPRAIDTLEWFATPGDLCNVMRALKLAGDQPSTARVDDVLAINPGIPDPARAFSYVGYKGGSEPGVLNLTWLLRRQTDQKWLFLTVGWNDSEKAIDEDRAVYVAGAARALLAVP